MNSNPALVTAQSGVLGVWGAHLMTPALAVGSWASLLPFGFQETQEAGVHLQGHICLPQQVWMGDAWLMAWLLTAPPKPGRCELGNRAYMERTFEDWSWGSAEIWETG